MVSIYILAAGFLVALALNSWVVARASKMLGSSRGRFAIGFASILGLVAVGGCVTALAAILENHFPPGSVFASTLGLIAQIGVAYFIFKGVFSLDWLRTGLVLAAHFGVQVLTFALTVMLFKPYVAEAYVMPTKSMQPTVIPGDRFMTEKLMRPKRWDIITYRVGNPRREVYCKRLVGLPGEHLQFVEGNLYMNEKPVPMPSVVEGRYRMHIPGSKYHDGETFTLGADEVFVIGDNADISYDSRSMGPSKMSDIIGVVDWTYWPLNRLRLMNPQ